MSAPGRGAGDDDDHRRFVLDSFALLAYYRSEPGGAAVAELLERAQRGAADLVMTVINQGEVFYRAVREHGLARGQELLRETALLPVRFVEVDEQLALAGAEIKSRYAMSYADCIAAALAMRLDAVLVTGDPEFRRIEHHVRVLWLQRVEPPASEA